MYEATFFDFCIHDRQKMPGNIIFSPKVSNFAKDNDLPYIDIGEVESEKKKVVDTVIQALFIDKDKTKSN